MERPYHTVHKNDTQALAHFPDEERVSPVADGPAASKKMRRMRSRPQSNPAIMFLPVRARAPLFYALWALHWRL